MHRQPTTDDSGLIKGIKSYGTLHVSVRKTVTIVANRYSYVGKPFTVFYFYLLFTFSFISSPVSSSYMRDPYDTKNQRCTDASASDPCDFGVNSGGTYKNTLAYYVSLMFQHLFLLEFPLISAWNSCKCCDGNMGSVLRSVTADDRAT